MYDPDHPKHGESFIEPLGWIGLHLDVEVRPKEIPARYWPTRTASGGVVSTLLRALCGELTSPRERKRAFEAQIEAMTRHAGILITLGVEYGRTPDLVPI